MQWKFLPRTDYQCTYWQLLRTTFINFINVLETQQTWFLHISHSGSLWSDCLLKLKGQSKRSLQQFVQNPSTHQVLLCLGINTKVCAPWGQNHCQRVSQFLSLYLAWSLLWSMVKPELLHPLKYEWGDSVT